MVKAASVLVGGGTGFIGRHLVRILRSGGAKVRIITRQAKGKPDHVSWRSIINDGLPEGTTAVVNLAGRNILEPGRFTEAYRQEIYTSRIETNRILVKAIQSAQVRPKAFIATSGAGYYPPSETFEYDENWTQPDRLQVPATGDTGAGKYLMELARDWEKASELDESRAPEVRRVIIRAGVVIGRDGGMIANLKIPFSLGLGGPIGSGNQWLPWIHVHDLANLYKFAIINDHISGPLNGVAPEIITNKQFSSAFGKALNRPAMLPSPQFVTNIVFGSDRAEILTKGQKVKSKAELAGFRFEYPTIQKACEECAGSLAPSSSPPSPPPPPRPPKN